MVQKLKGFFLVLLVVLLSLVFALQFGGGQAEGCTAGGSTYLARVYDKTISRGDFQAAYAIGNFDRLPAENQESLGISQLVLDGLVDRTLLAREARDLGFDVSPDDVMDRFVNDGVVMLTLGTNAPLYLPQGELPISFTDKEGVFNSELAKRYIQNGLRRSVSEFAESQAEEFLAEKMRTLIASNISVSDAEVWDEYVRANDTARVKYARFSPSHYEPGVPSISNQELTKWMSDHDAELEKEYETEKHRYTNLEKEVRARHILIKAAPGASEEEKTAARKKAEALRERAIAGTDFAALAAENSDDTASAAKGGDLGYNAKGRMVQAFDDAQFALEPGEISEVVETPFGFHVIKVEAVREGDVPKEDAKRELAARLYRQDWMDSAARKAATRLLSEWKASGGDEAVEKKLKATAKGPLAPTLQETDVFGRTDNPIPGLPANALIESVFALDEGVEMPASPVKVGREWVVFRVTDRVRPDEEGFTETEKNNRRMGLRALKEYETHRLYIQRLREKALSENALRVNQLPAADGTS